MSEYAAMMDQSMIENWLPMAESWIRLIRRFDLLSLSGPGSVSTASAEEDLCRMRFSIRKKLEDSSFAAVFRLPGHIHKNLVPMLPHQHGAV